MRYLVVIPAENGRREARSGDVQSGQELTIGDTVLVDELLVRVRFAVDVPADDG